MKFTYCFFHFCCRSKNDSQVTNVDENGNETYRGHMHVTADSLILSKNEKPIVVWPLSTVRRYGFDRTMFCFEVGRKSPLGPGMFAFVSKDAPYIYCSMRKVLNVSISLGRLSRDST